MAEWWASKAGSKDVGNSSVPNKGCGYPKGFGIPVGRPLTFGALRPTNGPCLACCFPGRHGRNPHTRPVRPQAQARRSEETKVPPNRIEPGMIEHGTSWGFPGGHGPRGSQTTRVLCANEVFGYQPIPIPLHDTINPGARTFNKKIEKSIVW